MCVPPVALSSAALPFRVSNARQCIPAQGTRLLWPWALQSEPEQQPGCAVGPQCFKPAEPSPRAGCPGYSVVQPKGVVVKRRLDPRRMLWEVMGI